MNDKSSKGPKSSGNPKSVRQAFVNLSKATSLTDMKQAASAHSKVASLLNRHQKTQAKIHKERINQQARIHEESPGIPKINSWSRILARRSESQTQIEYKTPSPAKPQSPLKQLRDIARSTNSSCSDVTISLSGVSTLNANPFITTQEEIKDSSIIRPQRIRGKDSKIARAQSATNLPTQKKNQFSKGPSEREIVQMIFNDGKTFHTSGRKSESSLLQTSKNLGFAQGIDLDFFLTRTRPVIAYTSKDNSSRNLL